MLSGYPKDNVRKESLKFRAAVIADSLLLFIGSGGRAQTSLMS